MARRGGAIHVVTNRRLGTSGKEYVSHLLRRTYREGGKVRNETVGNVSHLPAELVELIRRYLRGERFLSVEESFAVERSLPHGHVEAALQMARRLGKDWGEVTAHAAWDELRSLSPMHAGMAYERLEAMNGIQWPCLDEDHPGSKFLHGRLWEEDPEKRGPAAPLSVVPFEPPVDELNEEFPIRLTTGRRLDSFNTGVQTGGYTSPLRKREALCISPEDAERLGVAEQERVLVSSRRGKVEAPVHIDPTLRLGLAFLTLHFPDQVDTNALTIEAWDPKSGTAEFKASAIRIDRIEQPTAAAGGGGGRIARVADSCSLTLLSFTTKKRQHWVFAQDGAKRAASSTFFSVSSSILSALY